MSMLEPGNTYDTNGSEAQSIIETADRSSTCCDCGAPVPVMDEHHCAVFEQDDFKGDTMGVQRCKNCSDAYEGVVDDRTGAQIY